jgi:hypothetical protein
VGFRVILPFRERELSGPGAQREAFAMRLALLSAAAASLFLMAGQAAATTVDVSVDGHSGPWQWNAGLNNTLEYGLNDQIAPTSVSAGFNFAAGGTFTITYLAGATGAFAGENPLTDDGNGDPTFDASGSTGNSGFFFPSAYIDPGQYPAFLNALIGAFADASGAVVGNPFLVGNGPFSVAAPGGATQLLLGVNDDIFSDNSGSLRVEVDGPGGVPEPAAWAMMIAGFGLAGAALRRRRLAAA